jgi:nitric oxide reductase NorD protein
MAEPEGLLAEGARRATVAVRELWWRARPPEARPELALSHVKRRLELLVAALFGGSPSILPADPPPPPTWLARLLGRAPDHLLARAAPASTDGTGIWLPRQMWAGDDPGPALARYRLLAVEQVARLARGTPARVPTDPLERDLYLLAEAVAVDRGLAHRFPGLVAGLQAERAAALAQRPALDRLTSLEGTVECMIRDALRVDPAVAPPTVPLADTPADSLTWARTTAARLRAAARGYRGATVVALWGHVAPPPGGPAPEREAGEPAGERPRPGRSASLRRRPRARRDPDDGDVDTPGTWMIRADEPMESAEDPRGLQRPADHDDDAKAADLADALSDLPEAGVVRTPGTPREVLHSDAGLPARALATREGSRPDAGIVYPEWDYRRGCYRPRGAVVWPAGASPGSTVWVEDVMARHAALVRRVRRRFDGLRARRARVGRQGDGAEIDLDAYVGAVADWRAGQPGDDRFYIAVRPARRDLAIALLVDVSASTDGWASGSQRIIDVEKESLIVLLEALDALGDRHAALAFCGEGPGAVRVLTIKDFDERGGMEVRRRVAALEPDGYTRTGAAVRHASAVLAGQAARHRLLLVLSDGKPNDVDQYEGRYGIEDTRQAVAEARLQGLVPFCVTVDRDAPAYMPAMFGGRGYAVLRRQEFLPAVLVEVVRTLLVR